ncbi:hypothetical protein [Acetobacter orleanensis]|uniref:Uncharacterized protein n=1 Tax=Acetobacter orleanensis TaxID=104099 RepID=A0A4Y3TGN6_9PROT|nr:hypothetical protein [Acetobacter orleanensis]KXV62897.1 hypothetical protein AD949_09120 [Acetobacter orleanensis]PCD80675.1 hypothetical protein CO710_02855 [Acetobacter orleanensis]GAN67977.1 hypothetical protein Abol_014_028 [Acetobacter orleanensis JCM 7639]GBR27458.1 hypothetical protein AA0473_1444 [Acetobacter orleanensis NRIC 0473]GEB82101.1 hypothetical protein AOR01nite_05780 [Acetobacter orleanensis]
MKNNSVTPALVFLVVDVALGVAFVLLPPVVMSFLMLLKDVFGVLILPFSFLFGLAGWSSDMSSLGSVMGGLTPTMLRHPFRAIIAAAFIAVGGLCSVLACSSPRAAHVERIIAPLLTVAAIALMGLELAVILLPALLLQLSALRYPEMDFFSRRK